MEIFDHIKSLSIGKHNQIYRYFIENRKKEEMYKYTLHVQRFRFLYFTWLSNTLSYTEKKIVWYET